MGKVKRRKISEASDADTSSEEYFETDVDSLKEAFEKKLSKFVPRKSQRAHRDQLAKLFRDMKSRFDEYCETKPIDQSWKLFVDNDEIPDIESSLRELRTAIKESSPSIRKIVKSPLSSEQKQKALLLFDILHNVEPYTHEWLKIRESINDMIKSSGKESFETKVDKLCTSVGKKEIIKKVGINKKDWYLELPYEKVLVLNPEDLTVPTFLGQVRKKLDNELYGMSSVKDELIMLLHNRLRNSFAKSSIGLCGPPGTGKTSVASAFARAIQLPFERIALGGSIDSTLFKGSDTVWNGAHPSVLISFMRRSGCANGVVLFDEIDKLSDSVHGTEVQCSLLEITDSSQNHSFRDAYLNEISHDLSMLWFMFSMNSKEKVNKVLLDRVKVIDIPPYSKQDLLIVTKDYVFPRICGELGVKDVSLSEQVCKQIVEQNGSQSLRKIEDVVFTLISRISLEGRKEITSDDVSKLKTKTSEINFKMYS